jgi:hypothetical protein
MIRQDVHLILLGLLLANACLLFKSGVDLALNPLDVERQLEFKLAPAVADLQKFPIVHYYNCDDEVRTAERNGPNAKIVKTLEMNVFTGMRNFYASEYVLCPTILKLKTKEEPPKICLCLSSKEAAIQEFCAEQKMTVLKNYGRGVYVLKPND